MVEFGLISETEKGNVRTTVIYKYYYSPNLDKRICVHVKHEILNESKVKGIKSLDGKFGTLATLLFRSERVHRLNFGEISPFLHVDVFCTTTRSPF